MPSKIVFTADQIDYIREQYAKGTPICTIATGVPTSTQTVTRQLEAMNILLEDRSLRKVSKKQRDYIVKRYQEASAATIAKELGINRKVVCRLLKQQGITPHRLRYPTHPIKAGKKICLTCKEEKDIQEYRVSKGWLMPYCKPCANRQHRISRLIKQYGITMEAYELLFDKQHGVCAICHKPETHVLHRVVKVLGVDHNHATGAVRGLLCTTCNSAIGFLDDDPKNCIAAAQYLMENSLNE